MAFILGKELKMTQLWKENKIVPVTLVAAGPITVTQIRMKGNDGYEAVQAGFGTKKAKNINKPQLGQFKNLGNFQYVKEFKLATDARQPVVYKVGDVLDVSQFQEGESVKVSGKNRGRGFQGTVKRHGFAGGPKTHGQKNRLRAPGSIGATAPQRVMKGKKMAGRMGQERITVKNLKIAGIDKENNILMIKGAVPGMKGTLLEIRSVR